MRDLTSDSVEQLLGGYIHRRVRTDSDGRFTIRDVLDRAYRVVATDGDTRVVSTRIAAGTDDVTLTLP